MSNIETKYIAFFMMTVFGLQKDDDGSNSFCGVYPGSIGANGVLADGHDVLQLLVCLTLMLHEGEKDVLGREVVVVLLHVRDECGIYGAAVFDAVVEVVAAPSQGGSSRSYLFIALPSVL